MKRLVAVMATFVALIGALTPARAGTGVDRLMENSRFCDPSSQFRPGPASADGPSSQIAVHNAVFEPAYARACQIGSGLLTYLGTGERAGIEAILNRNPSRAFGTADVPLTPLEAQEATFDLRAQRGRNTSVHQIPLMVTVTAVAYNLQSCPVARLNLRSPVLSAIFFGRITKWNDAALTADNKGLANCNFPIRLVKRADFAGSTATFKDYLAKRNPQWQHYKQPAQNQVWPTLTNACPALDDDAMADCIASTQNSIGYLQYHTARLANLKTAFLDNPVSQATIDPSTRDTSRAFIGPSPQACTEAADSAFVPPGIQKQPITVVPGFFTYETQSVSPTRLDWSTVSLTDAPKGYPLCSFGYAFIYISLQTAYVGHQFLPNTARTAVDYLWTSVGPDAQSKLPGFDYGRLPPKVVDVAQLGLSEIRFEG